MKRTALSFALLIAIPIIAGPHAWAQGQAEKTIAPGLVRYQNQQVVRLRNDRLKSFYLGSRGGSDFVLSKSSIDNGNSWSEEDRALAFSSRPRAFEGMWSLVTKDNRIHFFFYNESGIWHSQPNDTGWGAPVQIFAGHPGVLRSAVETSTGRLVLPFYYEVQRNWWDGSEKGFDRFAFMGNYVVSTLYSDDAGETWSQSSDVIKIPTPSLGQNGAVDPIILAKADGTLWMLVANQRGWLYETFSGDGVHWSEIHPSRFISSEGPPAIARLKDGRVVLLWNSSLRFPYLHGGLYVLHAAVSDDDGNTWRGFREVYRDPFRSDPAARGSGYGAGFPTVIATGDGKLLVHAGQGKSAATFFLDRKFLYATRQMDGFSRGLDGWSVFGTKGVDLIEASGRKVLRIKKGEDEWPAAAVWNFPAGQDGKLIVRLRLDNGFGGAHLSLTDHYSVPFDPESDLNAVFDLPIGLDGRIEGASIPPGKWHDLEFNWDAHQRRCSVLVDGRPVTSLPQLKLSGSGPNYLRLHATPETTRDGGFDVAFVSADVAPKSGMQLKLPKRH